MDLSTPLPPHSVELEESVLGCMIANAQELKDGLAILEPCDFFIERNAWVFEAVKSLSQRGDIVDFLTVNIELGRMLKQDDLGGPTYISRLINRTASFVGSARTYASQVKELSTRRKMLELASKIAQSAYDESSGIDATIAGTYEKLRDITPQSNRTQSISEPANALQDDVEMFADNPIGPDDVRGFSLGILHLDRLTGGLQQDDLTVITARPGVGKTALVLQSADVLAESGKRVLIYSLEMRAKRLLRRMASRRARVDWKRVDRGWADGDELARVMRELGNLSELPIVINDDNHVTTAQMSAEVDRLRPDLVIVDNINIMLEPSAYANENDVKRIGRVSRNLKILANDNYIPVVCIAHMNRQSEARSDKRPTLSDLRESGEIEQNADNVLGMYRDMRGEEQASNIVEVWPLKLRDGDTSRLTKFIYEGMYYNFIPAETQEKSYS